MGIEYGGYVFSDPVPLTSATMPDASGLFAIQLFDSRCGTPPFKPIYFGESENFAAPAFPLQHEDYERWVHEARYAGLLFISFFKTPLWNVWCRRNATAKLVADYVPPCNVAPAAQESVPEMAALVSA